jgi:beta-N-acetylhexosaminidase
LSNPEARAVVFGCAGARLTDWERDFFRDAAPLGFILFARNCESPAQIRALVSDLREAIGRADAPILIDQEGGRVARLQPPHWRRYPAAASLAALGGERASEAIRLCARLIADDLFDLGVSVDCAPVLDVPVPGADPVIGDRAYGTVPEVVARLGRAVCEGLLEGGVLPVIKHIPGHGRAGVDSHAALPRVSTDRATLEASDFVPFRTLAAMPWAMTAHIVYEALDPDLPATLSPRVIRETIRGSIGFDGVLVSDDLSMHALGGPLEARARKALAAGCDLVLHCNGGPAEMDEVAAGTDALSPAAWRRLARAEVRRQHPAPFDRSAAEARLDKLVSGHASCTAATT